MEGIGKLEERRSVVVSSLALHAEGPGSIPGEGTCRNWISETLLSRLSGSGGALSQKF